MLQQDTEIIPIALVQSCLREWFGGGAACTDKMYFAAGLPSILTQLHLRGPDCILWLKLTGCDECKSRAGLDKLL
jgi:hypothetical protein